MPQLPAVAIILVIEHIAIAKSMGRTYNYTVNPSQEIVALGAANLFSPFMGGFVCTGSFGASAVLSKAGVRTPLAGLFSALVLVLALYALTAVFYYIPNAALAGLIIHAVCNLLAPPKNLYKYWQLSPPELLIWVTGVLLAIFESLEISIYVGISLSIVLLLLRLARTRGKFLGRVRAHRVSKHENDFDGSRRSSHDALVDEKSDRDVFLPLDRKDASNPDIKVKTPYPGVFIYRFSEGYNYTNQAYHVDTLVTFIKENTQRMTEEHFEKESDRLWNDPGPKKQQDDDLPCLRAVVLDFSAVNNLDITCIQGLIDLRNSLDRYSAPDAVEWHFANVHNRWTRRALASAGFGYPTSQNPESLAKWTPVYSIAATLGEKDVQIPSESRRVGDLEADAQPALEIENKSFTSAGESTTTDDSQVKLASGHGQSMAAIYGVDLPFFHIDLLDAVEVAVRDAHNKDNKPEH